MKNKFFTLGLFIALSVSTVFAFGSKSFEDGSRRTVGYISSSGTVEDSSRRTIGYINSSGSVENNSRRTIGYAKDIDKEHAAAFFFFFFKEHAKK